jgi:short subunit dehydrogenase-like uncharacterized protein
VSPRIGLYGAYGHTGRLVLHALLNLGFTPIVAGRRQSRVAELAKAHGLDGFVADVADAEALDELGDTCDALVNCAGPFGETAFALIDTAIRHRIPYADIGADPHVLLEIAEFDERARSAGVTVAPALGFWGALSDWMAEALCDGHGSVDRIEIAYVLSDWVPTPGTLAAAAALGGRRVTYRGKSTNTTSAPPAVGEHDFAAPFGRQQVVVDYPSPDAVLLPRHLDVVDIEVLVATKSLGRIMKREPPAGGVADNSGEAFRLEVAVLAGGGARRGTLGGYDIYRVTALVVAAAVSTMLRGDASGCGVLTPAQVVAPDAALVMLERHGVAVGISQERS